MGLPAERLESSLEGSLDNEFIPEHDPTVYYVGEFNLSRYDKNFNIRGRASLTKYKKRRIFSKEVWRVQTDIGVWFVKDGKVINDFKDSEGYRVGLRNSAHKIDINLSRTLFKRVFDPMDERLMEIYRQAVTVRDS